MISEPTPIYSKILHRGLYQPRIHELHADRHCVEVFELAFYNIFGITDRELEEMREYVGFDWHCRTLKPKTHSAQVQSLGQPLFGHFPSP